MDDDELAPTSLNNSSFSSLPQVPPTFAFDSLQSLPLPSYFAQPPPPTNFNSQIPPQPPLPPIPNSVPPIPSSSSQPPQPLLPPPAHVQPTASQPQSSSSLPILTPPKLKPVEQVLGDITGTTNTALRNLTVAFGQKCYLWQRRALSVLT